MVRAAEPVFVTVTTCAVLEVFSTWLAKVRLPGAKLIAGAAVPVPVNAIVCGLPAALSVTVIAPVRAPATVGVKITVIVHVPATATEEQVLV